MAVDILAASRRPLQRLLHDCSFSEWENIALFLDGGSTEAVRWAGGLGFVMEELGISQVLDLQAFAPGTGGATTAPGSEGLTRGIFLVTTFVWDIEGAVLNAARTYGLNEVTVACSVSEEAHACHPDAEHISEETGGRVSFSVVSQQLRVTLERLLKIDAQSSSSSRRRFSTPPSSSSQPAPYDSAPAATEASLYSSSGSILHLPPELHSDSSPSVLVTVVHSPLHVGCFFQPSASRDTAQIQNFHSKQQTQQQQKGCSAFSLASPACARVFPLRRCDWKGRGGAGAGAALFAAAAAVEGGGGGDGSTEGQVSAEEVPKEERLRYRLLAHTLVEVLWDQLLLDVSGDGAVFTLGDTSRLIGTTVVAAAEDKKRVSLERSAFSGFRVEGHGSSGTSVRGGGHAGSGGPWSSDKPRREASVILIDRTLDLAAPASHGGSLLQRILSSIARTGTTFSASEAVGENCSPASAAHQHDVGVVLPMLAPGLGLPARPVERAGGSNGLASEKPPRLLAMKALAGFSWPAPPALCHSGSSSEAAGVVHAMASLREEEGQAALISALEKCVSENGCTPPPRKRRGMGSSIMALVTSLSRGNPRPGGLSGDRVCLRCRGVIQVALAAMEAHQRTSSLAGSAWSETVGAERVQLQQLRDGSNIDAVMEQLCATLQQAPPAASSSSPPTSGSGAVRASPSTNEALLLALRGVSLAGESIRAKDASSFRKAWTSRMMVGGIREQGSGVPPGVAEAVERLRSAQEGSSTIALGAEGGLSGEQLAEEAGIVLELEDIATERTQRLREAAASRSFHLKNTGVLRDLAFEPYTFVASAGATASASGAGTPSGGVEEEWDDWGDDDDAQETTGVAGRGETSTEHTTECDTLVGRLAGLLLDRTSPDVPDLHEAKLVSAASVGLGLLSSGLKKLSRIGGAAGAVGRGRHSKSRPSDRPVVVLFVVGGFTPLELAEVSGVLRCAAAAAAAAPGGGLETEVILAGTTVSTPDLVFEQIFTKPPAAGNGCL